MVTGNVLIRFYILLHPEYTEHSCVALVPEIFVLLNKLSPVEI